ncbi:MAG: methyltransferase domain-containing protein [Terrimonas sp.]|nr:methyltransferase domain-containing protein [Terrimonas sp.]
MEPQLQEIRDQQKNSWNKFSPGWKKWDEMMMDFLKPMGDEIIQKLELKEGDLVLDMASGTGEPGLTIAKTVKNGKVILTDLSDGMLEVAKENASRQGIHNIETHICDVCELPYPDNTFDAISCRFGFMFFPDMQMAASEMVRVLKPGGRLATTVWYLPERNFWVTAIGGTINRNMQLTPPPPEAPGMFRCAKNGMILDIFKKAGLSNITETEVAGLLKCGTADVYWNIMTDVAAPFVSALSKADDAMREKIKKEVFELIHQKYSDGKVMIDSCALLIAGQK